MPYAPGITYTGGESIARGIDSFGQSVGQGLAKWREDSQKAKSLRQVVKAYNPDVPTDHMSLGDLEGMVQGEAIKQAQRTQSLAEQLKQDQLAVQRGHLTLSQQQQAWHESPDNPANVYQGSLSAQLDAGIKDRQAGAERLANFNRAMSDQANRLGEIGLNPNANDVLRLAAQTGTLGDANVDRVLAAQTRWGNDGGGTGSLADDGKLNITEDDLTGYRWASKNGQPGLHFSGVNPSKIRTEGKPVTDAEGNIIGYDVPSGRNGSRFVGNPNKLTHNEIIAGLKIQDPALKKAFTKHLMEQFPDMAEPPAPPEEPGLLTKAWRATFGGPAPAAGQTNKPVAAPSVDPVGTVRTQNGVKYKKTATGWQRI